MHLRRGGMRQINLFMISVPVFWIYRNLLLSSFGSFRQETESANDSITGSLKLMSSSRFDF